MTALTLPSIEVLADTAAALVSAAHDADDRTNENALNKAVLQLHLGCVPVATTGGFLVESRTRAGLVHRVSATHGCNCEAGRSGKACWHQSLIEIIETAQQQTVSVSAYEEALAELMECF